MASDAPTPFQPSEGRLPAILADLRRPDLSFSDLARLHDTTPDALAVWMVSPRIAALTEATDSIVCYRTRLIAAEHATIALGACINILKDFNAAHASRAAAPLRTDEQSAPDSELLKYRAAEAARKAAAIVVRFTRLARTPGPSSVARQPTPIGATAPRPARAEVSGDVLNAPAALAADLETAGDASPESRSVDEKRPGEPRSGDNPPRKSVPPEPGRNQLLRPQPRTFPFPAKQLWRNTPGAATARAP
jgi:hypothetical protein